VVCACVQAHVCLLVCVRARACGLVREVLRQTKQFSQTRVWLLWLYEILFCSLMQNVLGQGCSYSSVMNCVIGGKGN